MTSLRVGLLLTALFAGPSLWSQVQTGRLDASTAITRAVLVTMVITAGAAGIQRLFMEYEQEQAEAQAEEASRTDQEDKAQVPASGPRPPSAAGAPVPGRRPAGQPQGGQVPTPPPAGQTPAGPAPAPQVPVPPNEQAPPGAQEPVPAAQDEEAEPFEPSDQGPGPAPLPGEGLPPGALPRPRPAG